MLVTKLIETRKVGRFHPFIGHEVP